MTDTLPRGAPEHSLVQLLRIMRDPYAFFDHCRAEYGDTFTLRFTGSEPYVWSCHPEIVKWVFTRPREEFSHVNDLAGVVIGARSVLFMDGEEHRRERQMLMPPFHGSRMRSYGEIMRDTAGEVIARWPEGTPFVLHEQLQDITLRVTMKTVFGIANGPLMERLHGSMTAFLDGGMTPLVFAGAILLGAGSIRDTIERWGTSPSLLRKVRRLFPLQALADARAEIDAVLFDEIARARSAPDPTRPDILAMFVAARDEQGQPMTDTEIRDELLTVLVAGHETTATTMSWALHHVLRTEGVAEKIRAELDRVFEGGPVDPAKMDQLVYLKAVVNETLRMSPIALGVLRRLKNPVELAGHHLPAGTVISPSVYLTHRHPDLWENPNQFMPERFLGKDPSPFQFFPFGGGTRRCVGVEMARYTMRVVLAQLFSAVVPERVPSFHVRPEMRGITVGPTVNMPIITRPRTRPSAAVASA